MFEGKMNMKKAIAILLVLTMLLPLTGCGGDNEKLRSDFLRTLSGEWESRDQGSDYVYASINEDASEIEMTVYKNGSPIKKTYPIDWYKFTDKAIAAKKNVDYPIPAWASGHIDGENGSIAIHYADDIDGACWLTVHTTDIEFAELVRMPDYNADIPEKYVGTYTLYKTHNDDDPITEEFTISKDGTLTFNSQSYALFTPEERYKDISGGDNFDILFHAKGNNRIRISECTDGVEMFALSVDDRFPQYYFKDVETAELTAENWQDFFEPAVKYEAGRDNWGDISYFYTRIKLVPKDNIEVFNVDEGRIAVTVSPKAFAEVKYDASSEEFAAKEISRDEYTAYEHLANYLESWPKDLEAGFYSSSSTSSWYDPYVEFLAVREEHFTNDGDAYTFPAISAFEIDVTRIMGTIIYKNE